MKKIFTIFLLAISTTLSIYGENEKAKVDFSSYTFCGECDHRDSSDHDDDTPWVTVTVTYAAGLTTAIQIAATNITASTIIYIDGIIQGNFIIPPTVNQI